MPRFLLTLFLFAVALPASAATFTVTKTADTNDGTCDADCSLREAVAAATASPGPDHIRFDPALAGQTLGLTGGQLVVNSAVRIDGGTLGITVSGNNASRVFRITGSPVELVGLTVASGRVGGWNGGGGGIWNSGGLTLTRCTVRNNRAGTDDDEEGGGGILNEGALTVVESTIRDNAVGSYSLGGGAALYNRSLLFGGPATAVLVRTTVSGKTAGCYPVGGIAIENGFDGYGPTNLTLIESTVSGNRLAGSGCQFSGPAGAIASLYDRAELIRTTVTKNDQGISGDFLLENAIVLGNDQRFVGNPNCNGVTGESQGHNVVGTDCPASGPGDVQVPAAEVFSNVLNALLQDNGGPTLTHRLMNTSTNPARDIGGDCGPVDQRGVPAPLDDSDPDALADCDAGAVEMNAFAVVPTLTPDPETVSVPEEGGRLRFSVTLANVGNQQRTLQAWTRVAQPNGETTGPLAGPLTVTLQPGQSVTRALTQVVPASAPGGRYHYLVYVGGYPDGPLNGASFAFEKAGSPAREGDIPGVAAWFAGGWEDAEVASGGAELTDGSSLSAASPNPFTSQARLALSVSTAQHVRAEVFDARGRRVAVLLDGVAEGGAHALVLHGAALPAGVYVVRVTGETFETTRRVTLVR